LDVPGFSLYFRQISFAGIVSSSGSNWKHQRSFALAKLRGFGFGKRSFESRIMEEIEAFLELLGSYKREPFDLTGILNTSMANNVMSITIGRRFDYDDPEFVRFIEIMNDLVSNPSLAGPVNFVPSLSKIPGDPFRITPVTKKVDMLFDYFRKQIKEHKETIDDCNIRDFTDTYIKEMKKDETFNSTPNYSGIATLNKCMHIILFY
jgi:cytochrome P450 family 2 subfamily U polypeptide 1